MAEALALQGAKMVASPIISSLLREGFSYLGIGVSTNLRDLEATILPQFQLMIEAAERSNEHRSELEQWLRRLKDALYEAEDMLDLYKYQLLEEKVSDLNTYPTLKPFMKVAQMVNAGLSILSPHKIKLRRSLNKLEEIAAEAKTFRELLGMRTAHDFENRGQPNVMTSISPSKVFGRDEERDEIIDKYLLDQSEASKVGKSYSVVSITGIGGAGKSTLAQLVYNDQRVINHFDIKMWICVSRKLDVFRHTREMVESASKNECSRFENLDVLQSKLIDLIKSNKVLLVLDDVWYDNTVNETEWENLLAPLATAAKKGSKILVTTRIENLPVAFHPKYSMPLRDLEENVIVSLFMHHAFGGAKLIDLHLQKELEDIGKQIVQKLHRSPLAAKAVGGRLSKMLEANFWRAALEQDNLRDTQQVLLWSYQRLDAPLQHCFSYFSLFPKGYSFKAEKIVRLWIAEGFINSSNNSMRLEDIGMSYFGELVSGSFLQLGDCEIYSMHDLFHDLAENISKEDYLRIEDDQAKEISPTIRHMYISNGSLLENNRSLNKVENLRTLIIKGSISPSAIDHVFATIEKYHKLRVLDLSGLRMETLPKSIGDLKHLRYLDLYQTELAELPVVLGKLYHLQVLIPPYYCATTLPRSLKNLISLRHLEGYHEALTRIPYIGRRLTSLQTLREFHVKKEKGYDIGQLRNLNELRGSLTIWNLENIEGKDKAVEANLKNKKYLESLKLNWCRIGERNLDMEVLEGLQPHPNLTKLTVRDYKSPRFPRWLPLQNLRSLEFYDCTGLEDFPPMRYLFPHCENLKFLFLPNLRKFSLLPLSLKELEICHCGSLVFVSQEEAEEIVEDIFWGKKKSELILPSSLQSLVIWECDITEGALSQSLERLTSLKSLKLGIINTITTLPSDEILNHLIALTHLHIYDCRSLKSIGGLYALPSLEELTFESCRCLELEMVMPAGEGGGRSILPPSLRQLKIRDCPSLASLSLCRLTALKQLTIGDCPSILGLPGHLPESLTSIYIYGCPALGERMTKQ